MNYDMGENSDVPEGQDNTGPVYGVRLISSLPIGNGFEQAMPNRQDLAAVRARAERVVAGYEVLLSHYQQLDDRFYEVKSLNDQFRERSIQQAAQLAAIRKLCQSHNSPASNTGAHKLAGEVLRIIGG